MRISGKKALRFATRTLCGRVCKNKVRNNPERYFTLKEICEKVGIDTSAFSDAVNERSNVIVPHISRYGDRLFKNSVCVQLYDDTDEVMKKAMQEGALVCVTEHEIDGVPCIVVPDAAAVYADMCILYNYGQRLKTVAISGSIGKTTAKKMVEAVFKSYYNTLCDANNGNLLDSVGFVVQHVPKNSEAYVAECSEDTPGMLKYISKVVRPDISIITVIDKSHIEHYGSQENINKEILSLTDYMREDGVCITSLDEENTANLIKDKKVVFVSTKNRDADYFADNIRIVNEGLRFDVVEKSSGKSHEVLLVNVYGKHNVYPAMLAFAAGVCSGIPYDRIVAGLANYRAYGIRQNAYRSKGVIIYADCYNAVAKSVRSAIEACENIPVKGKKIAVLGDIEEAGEFSESTHLEIADIVDKSGFGVLLAFGSKMIAAVEKTSFRDDLTVIPCRTRAELNNEIKKYAKRGDLVLFKSSHSGKLNHSILATFPFAYLMQGIRGIPPKFRWHFKIITH